MLYRQVCDILRILNESVILILCLLHDTVFHRWLTGDLVELTSKIFIPLKAFLTHDVGIPFKYVVYSPRAENSKYLFEYLHGIESHLGLRSTYRCLAVPKSMCKPGG